MSAVESRPYGVRTLLVLLAVIAFALAAALVVFGSENFKVEAASTLIGAALFAAAFLPL